MINKISSMDAMEKEVRYQVYYLHDLNLPEKVSFENCVIVGSGDSYAAALIASYASNRKLICCDPMEISFNPEIVKNRSVYILSVSGNTKSNIQAAKASRKLGSLTCAITSKPQSILARNCDKVIELKYKTTGISTSGTISFTASLLSCLSLIGKASKASMPSNLKQIYRQTYRQAKNLSMSISSKKKVSTIILLGEGILFPLALYGTLKINEVLGLRSFAYSVEEFCHSPLFGLKKSDQVIIFGYTPKNIIIDTEKTTATAAAKKLNGQLQRLGYSSEYVDCASNSDSLTELLLRSTILLQLFVIRQARLKGLKECIFLRKKNLLEVSSGFIYQ